MPLQTTSKTKGSVDNGDLCGNTAVTHMSDTISVINDCYEWQEYSASLPIVRAGARV